MIFITKQIKKLLCIVLLASTAAHANLHIPARIQGYQHAINQRAFFAKSLIKNLWQGNNHAAIEKTLAKAYAIVLSPTHTAQNAVSELLQAIKNSPWDIKQFYIGASSSHYQIEGGLDHNSAAARFYKNKANLPTAGDAIDFFNRYKDDIRQLKKELHINALRISIAWNRVEPERGVFDQEAIEFYRDVIATLLAHGIKPIVVFHHYDSPTWFEDLGGFEKEQNGEYFSEFCTYVYLQLAQELGHCFISLCNAPEGPAFKGYFTGDGTPGEKDNLHKTHTVIANMYYELVEAALQIKRMSVELKRAHPALKKPCIGTQINVIFFDPYNSPDNNWKNRLLSPIGCAMATYIQCGGTANFLINGEYRMFTPDLNFMKQAKNVNVYRQHKDAHKAFDWIGVNIYSNNFLDGFKRINGAELVEQDEERYTDNTNYRNYPEGIYRAVQFITENITAPLGALRNKNGKPLPIIVTENGIATKNDAKHDRYYKQALCTITQLIKDGYYVIGYTPWTSHDNYEWPTQDNPEGFNSKCYGFFAVNRDKESPDYLKRTLKDGSIYYADFAKSFTEHA